MKIKALRDLPQDIAPPRDLWPGIAAQIAPAADAAKGSDVARVTPAVGRIVRLRWLAAAAAVACLAVGMWIDRSLLQPPGKVEGGAPTVSTRGSSGAPASLDVAYVPDARYQRQRAALLGSLQAQLNALPPGTRTKVLASLATIGKAKQDLESALGKNPGDALLQELLVNTYQDEMRVLIDVHTASNSGEGI
ncbi:MAG TPA: hypothetical protein VIY30_02345 [Burkholderiaceae bacterium]